MNERELRERELELIENQICDWNCDCSEAEGDMT